MKQNFTFCLLNVAMFMLPTVGAYGQKRLETSSTSPLILTTAKAEAKTTPEEQHRAFADFKAKHPLLFKARIARGGANCDFIDIDSNKRGAISAKRHTTALTDGSKSVNYILKAQNVPLGRELWANVLQSSRWYEGTPEYGIYSFGTNSSIEPNSLYTSPYMYANAGGAVSGERIDIINFNSSYGTMTHYLFDAKTGDYKSASYLSDYSLWSTETAVASDGTVYGVFYSADATRFELGVANYASDTRSTIGQVNHYYVALGITKNNVLYGVATDGNLYSIDITTAKETFVGSTGVSVLMSDGTWNVQSGEIDQTNDIFYWACTDSKGQSSLYTIDLTNGHATKIGDMRYNEQMTMLAVPTETVASAAPALAENLTVSFDKASLSGTIGFKAPTKTYNGDNLSGKLDYTVSVDGKVAKSGSTTVGAIVNETVNAKRGNRLFAVVFSNAHGNGPKAYTTTFVGDDTPKKASDVNATLDVTTGKVNVTWNAVTEGINSGYVSDIKYNVTRYPDGKEIASGITATSVDDLLPNGDLKGYRYAIVAVSGQRKSEESISNSITFGNMLEPPFTEGFDKSSDLDLFTIIDANNDGKTWSYCENDGSGQPSVQIEYGNVDHDDWLITPPLKLKAGVIYNISYRVASKGANYPELLEVKYGSEPTAKAMTSVLSEKEEITNQQYVTVKKELIPEKDGVVYFGFHCTSSADWCYQLVLDDITVTGNSQKSPDAVNDITVTPAADGSNKATVNFVAPAKAIDGSALTSEMEVSVMRDGEEIQNMAAIKPGQAYYYIDNEANNGVNTYSVIARNDAGEGRESKKVEAYVGLDTPNEVTNVKAVTADNSITLTWSPVTTGEHNGYVDPTDMAYNVYEIIETGSGINLPLVDQVDKTTITIPYDVNKGDQEMINYALSAENTKGEGPRVMSPGILVGKPYELPFEEHFKGGSLDHSMWWVSKTGASEFSLMQGMSSDGDNGCAGYVATDNNDQAILGSGKISLQGAENPVFNMSFKSSLENSDATITIYAHKPGQEENTTPFKEVRLNELKDKANDWHTCLVKFGKDYTTPSYMTMTLVVKAAAGETLYLDNITVRDFASKDLRASVSAPAKVRKGETLTVSVGVTNMGESSVNSAVVNLYAGGKLVGTKTIDGTLESFATSTLKFDYRTQINDASPLELKAEVAADDDSTPEDNVATTEVELLPSTKTAPDHVAATTTDGRSVDVEWTKIEATTETVTDDFESYTPWSMDEFGDWTAVYGEKGLAKGPFSRSYPHPNEGKKFAYTVVEAPTWLDSSVLNDYVCLKPHSGNRYLATFYSVENSQFVVADNWLISPSLPGVKQTITFWANNFVSAALSYPENFDVLYSTTGASLDNFKKAGASMIAEGGAWKQYSVELPEGATYFAIHNNTDDTYMFMLDDISYLAGCGMVTAYNIWRDGQLIKQVAANVNTFTDTTADGGSHRYGVSAVYSGGESEITFASPVTSIGKLVDASLKAPFDIYTVDGKLVRKDANSTAGLVPGLYVVGGKTINVR